MRSPDVRPQSDVTEEAAGPRLSLICWLSEEWTRISVKDHLQGLWQEHFLIVSGEFAGARRLETLAIRSNEFRKNGLGVTPEAGKWPVTVEGPNERSGCERVSNGAPGGGWAGMRWEGVSVS